MLCEGLMAPLCASGTGNHDMLKKADIGGGQGPRAPDI